MRWSVSKFADDLARDHDDAEHRHDQEQAGDARDRAAEQDHQHGDERMHVQAAAHGQRQENKVVEQAHADEKPDDFIGQPGAVRENRAPPPARRGGRRRWNRDRAATP